MLQSIQNQSRLLDTCTWIQLRFSFVVSLFSSFVLTMSMSVRMRRVSWLGDIETHLPGHRGQRRDAKRKTYRKTSFGMCNRHLPKISRSHEDIRPIACFLKPNMVEKGDIRRPISFPLRLIAPLFKFASTGICLNWWIVLRSTIQMPSFCKSTGSALLTVQFLRSILYFWLFRLPALNPAVFFSIFHHLFSFLKTVTVFFPEMRKETWRGT